MSEKPAVVPSALSWAQLKTLTPARIGLGQTGASLPIAEVLRFGVAYAQARDAVHERFRPEDIAAALAAISLETIHVTSAAGDRINYLRRPDLGRRLTADSQARLARHRATSDVSIVIADGLCAAAIHHNAVPLISALLPLLQQQGMTCAPLVIASQARVALGDEIGHLLAARMVLVLIGERPGLSSPDSLGAYLTFAPRPGLNDSARNCLSNIRPAGLSVGDGAYKLAWLMVEAFRRSVTGVDLKDESDAALANATVKTLPDGADQTMI